MAGETSGANRLKDYLATAVYALGLGFLLEFWLISAESGLTQRQEWLTLATTIAFFLIQYPIIKFIGRKNAWLAWCSAIPIAVLLVLSRSQQNVQLLLMARYIAFPLGILFLGVCFSRGRKLVLGFAIVAAIVIDLLPSFTNANFVYNTFEVQSLGTNLDLNRPAPSPQMRTFANTRAWRFEQAMRYPELILNQARVFSPVRRVANDFGRASILGSTRWPASFYRDEKVNEISFLIKSGFDPQELDVRLEDGDQFMFQARAKRWNSFYLLKDYFYLVNAGLSADLMQSFFAVGEPLFQLRRGIRTKPASDVLPQIQELDESLSGRDFFKTWLISDTQPSLSPAWTEGADLGPVPGRIVVNPNTLTSDHVTLQVLSPVPAVLYWSDSFDSGWKASLNGKSAPILRANYQFKAVEIPAGESFVSFDYRRDSFHYGILLYYFVAALGLLGILCLGREVRA